MESVSRTSIEWFNTRLQAKKAESRAVKREEPLWNIMLRAKVKKPRKRKVKRSPPVVTVRPSPVKKPAKTYWDVGPHLPPTLGPSSPNYIIEILPSAGTKCVTPFYFVADDYGQAMALKCARAGTVIIAHPEAKLTQDFMHHICKSEIHFYRMSAGEAQSGFSDGVQGKPLDWNTWRKKGFEGFDPAAIDEGKD